MGNKLQQLRNVAATSDQQKSYVKETKNGKTVNFKGKPVDPKSKEGRIPKDDYNIKNHGRKK